MWDEREQQKIDAIWRLPKGLVILILTFAVVALIVPMYVHTSGMRHTVEGHCCPHSRSVLHIMAGYWALLKKLFVQLSCVGGMCRLRGFNSALPLTIDVFLAFNIFASPLRYQACHGRCCIHGLLPIRQLRYNGRV